MTIASACSMACPALPRQGGHDRPSSNRAVAFDKAPSGAGVSDVVTRFPRDPHGRFVRRRANRSPPLARCRSFRPSRSLVRRDVSRAEARSMPRWSDDRRAYPTHRDPEGPRPQTSARHALPGRSRRVVAAAPGAGGRVLVSSWPRVSAASPCTEVRGSIRDAHRGLPGRRRRRVGGRSPRRVFRRFSQTDGGSSLASHPTGCPPALARPGGRAAAMRR